MLSAHTNYQAVYNLTELDVRNIEILTEHTGRRPAQAVHDAIYFCQTALQFNQSGQCVSILYKNSYQGGTTASINAADIASAYNNRPKNAQPVNLRINRHTDALQAINYIKKIINVQDDSTAVAFALEYAATTVRRIQNCNDGKYARVFFSYRNNPSQRGSVLKKHPFDLTMGNKFRRAGRTVKAGVSKLNPFKKTASIVVEERQLAALPAPAAATAPPQATTSAEDAAQKKLDAEIEKMQEGVSQPVKPLKPMTFRKGFNL